MKMHFTDSEVIDLASRQAFLPFAMKVFEILHAGGGEPFVMNWHIDAMCHALEKVRQRITLRQIMEVPPRHFKSIATSVAYSAWRLGLDPSTKLLIASYGADLAEKHSRDTRIVMKSPFYQRVFPHTRISVDQSLEIGTTAGGMRKAISLGGPVTGFGADVIIIDDLMKAADAGSPAELRRVHEYYTNTLVPRLNNQETGAIIVIQQRLAEYDLVGYLKEKGNFDVLSFPAIAVRSEDIPLGRGRIQHRDPGDLLFPARFSRETLKRLREEIGNATFSAQYQQDPSPPGGNRIRPEHFGTCNFVPERHMFTYVVLSWDTGFSEELTSDYSVCTIWGYRAGKWHLLDLIRGRYPYPELKRRALGLKDQWKADKTLIEKAASGYSLFQDLFRNHGLRGHVWAVKVEMSKELRLEAATAELEEGKFLLPIDAPWLDEFKHECFHFPNARHDDQVDSLVHFVNWQKMPRAKSAVSPAPIVTGSTRYRGRRLVDHGRDYG